MEAEAMTKPMLKASAGRKFFMIAFLILLGGIFVLPQDTPKKDASGWMHADIHPEIASALVAVRDKQGKLIKDLEPKDFTLKEDGRKQTIECFSQECDLPLTIGLILDNTRSIGNLMEPVQIAGKLRGVPAGKCRRDGGAPGSPSGNIKGLFDGRSSCIAFQ
jgi:hypothetical protein